MRPCSFGGKLDGLPPAFVWREVTWPTVAARVCLAGSCIGNCVLQKSKTINFDDNKIQSQSMNKSTNIESKEREIERDQESKRRRVELRRERERLRAQANRRNMNDEQRKKERDSAREKRQDFSEEQ